MDFSRQRKEVFVKLFDFDRFDSGLHYNEAEAGRGAGAGEAHILVPAAARWPHRRPDRPR